MNDGGIGGDYALGLARPPQQGRSRQSFERMMNAAEALLVEQGSDGFTLIDVSRVGRISIGSIYNRFASKDELIQAVHARAMERIEKEQGLIVMRARSKGNSPLSLTRAIVNELGEFLASNAPTMRPMMLRAAHDPIVQQRGRVAHEQMVEAVTQELLGYRDHITHEDPERAVRSIIAIAYAAFARVLGFGMTEALADADNWAELKEDVGTMTVRFLFSTITEADFKPA